VCVCGLNADAKAGGASGNEDADGAKDRRRVRDSLFSPSASESSSVGGEDDAEEKKDSELATKAPLFPSRAGSMMGANPRSRSANANSKKQFGDVRRRTMFPASSSFTLGSTTPAQAAFTTTAAEAQDNLSSSAVFPERRGLFEADDEAESLESFQERVKIRQSKKKSELDALRGQLEAAQERVDQLETQVVSEAREKQEFEIRMKECQRIIEKRNKQLMKASERMARFTEQSELMSTELQAKVATLTTENTQLRAEITANVEQVRVEGEQQLKAQQADFAAKLKQQERHMQGKLERAVEIAEQGVETKLAENVALRRKIQELETEVEEATAIATKARADAETATTAASEAARLSPSRIKQSEEYQTMLKQLENAEAISRGLRYQLDKEREEKKYLKQQLGAIQSSGTNVAGFFDGDAAVSKNNASPTSSAASAADLASFDFTAPPAVAAEVESVPPSPSNARQRSRSQSRSRSGSSGLFSSNPFGMGKHTDATSEAVDEAIAAEELETKRKKRGSSTSSLQTPLEAFSQESIDDANASPATSTQKSIASSVNFFEKFSIKFKRSSSPRNSATAGSARADEAGSTPTQPAVNTAVASSAMPSAAGSSVVSPLAHSAVLGRGKVLNERPRMYVARSPSHHEEESSDSIFGSESDSSSSFDSEDEAPPLPPPPPAQEASPPPPSDAHALPIPVPSQPVQVDAGAEADSSDSEESSSEDESGEEAPGPMNAGLPTAIPAPSVIGVSTTATQDQTRPQVLPATSSAGPARVESGVSSSDLSEDSSSDEDRADAPIDRGVKNSSSRTMPVQSHHPERTTRSKSERSSSSSSESSSSSSSSDDEVERLSSKRRSRGRAEESASDSKSSRKREKRSMSLPRSPDAATHHGSHHDARQKAAMKSRMNEYMEARTKKRNDKLKKKEEKEHAEHKKKEEYEKEWEKMAQEERERKRKQQQARRTGRRRPASMKTVRVSQMRQQMTKQSLQKDMPVHPDLQQRPRGDTMEEGRSRRHSQHRNESGSEGDDDQEGNGDESKPAAPVFQPAADSPPLPPEPTEADTELYIRQQARLRERHEMEMKRKQEADEADQVRGQIHRKVEMWAFGKELLHMILTLDQISNSDALKTCQLMVVQSPDNETVRKAYRCDLSSLNYAQHRRCTDRSIDCYGIAGASSA
jgi:hypothetical protein